FTSPYVHSRHLLTLVPSTTEIYSLSLHDALPIYLKGFYPKGTKDELEYYATQFNSIELNATFYRIFPADVFAGWYEKTPADFRLDRKSTRLNSSHVKISYAVFCLKKKNK